MPYEIELTEDSKRDIQALRSFERRKILDAIERHLRYEPTKESQSRIKRLRELARPQYRYESMSYVFFMISLGTSSKLLQ